jgi:putative nucleotidyltransferase with HDIG domain
MSRVLPDKLIDKITSANIPSLPTILQDVARKLDDPDTDVRDIGKLLKNDPVLTTRILRLVNSSYFSLPNKVTDVQRAVTVLGFKRIRSLVFSTRIIDLFPAKGTEEFNLEIFWSHALTTALAAEVVAEQVPGVSEEDAFLAGLLHDIGKILLAAYLPDIFAAWLQQLQSNPEQYPYEMEQQKMGADHGRIGAWFIKQWNMAPNVVTAVAFHHHPELALNSAQAPNAQELAAVVHVADIIARGVGIGCSPWDQVPPRNRQAWRLLNILPDQFDDLIGRLAQKVEDAEEFYNLLAQTSLQLT